MGLSGCYSVIKCLLVIINCIFGIAGLLTVSLALWMYFDPPFYVSMTEEANNFIISTSILFIAGLLLLMVFFLGCFGTFKESKCMLFTFFSILLVVLVAEIAAGVWGYINADSLAKVVHHSVRQTVLKEYPENESRRPTFDTIQQGLECCGADNHADWNNQKVGFPVVANPVMYDIPASCCRPNIEKQRCTEVTTNVKVGSPVNYDVIFKDGCYLKLMDALKHNSSIFLGVGIAIIVIEVLGLIFSLILAFAINKSGRYKA